MINFLYIKKKLILTVIILIINYSFLVNDSYFSNKINMLK